MKELVQNFTRQLRESLNIADKAIVSQGNNIQHIVITGLGGSGIGGTIVAELIADSCKVPVVACNDYFLPAFVNQHSLVIVSSYSGNTEETLSAMQQAIAAGAQLACVTSGGKVLELAKAAQMDFIEIPGGFPPRSCIGYSLVQLVKILVVKGFASPELLKQTEEAIGLLDSESESIKAEALSVAKQLHNKLPVLYSLGTCEGAVVRFRQQINENGKMLCWHHRFPEMNHNELVGWAETNSNLAVVTMRSSFDYERTVRRYEFCKPIFAKRCSAVIDIFAKGNSKMVQVLYHIHIGDWISCYLADLKGIDPVEVKVIDSLKAELSKY